MLTDADAKDCGMAFIHAYNQCFYDKDMEALTSLYSPTLFTGFWDNHANCDSDRLDNHLAKLSEFFSQGKTTESGGIEPLRIEELKVRGANGFLLLTAVLRYNSAPIPGVRSTFVLVEEHGSWKAIHIHHSFDPNE